MTTKSYYELIPGYCAQCDKRTMSIDIEDAWICIACGVTH